MNEFIRTFVAVEIPADFKDAAMNIQDDLQRFKCRVAWTKAAGMHLTLKFLGDTEPGLVDELGDAFADVASNCKPFVLSLNEPGVFGGGIPRVLWLGLDAPDELFSLQKELDREASKFGFPRENRKFHPHLTLGRVKDHRGTEEMVDRFKKMQPERKVFRAEGIVFFRSDLQPTGAVYTPLKRLNFQGEPSL